MKPRSMPMKLFGWFKRSQYPINRLPTYLGNSPGEKSGTLGLVFPIGLFCGIARLHQSRQFAQKSITIGQGIDSNRRNYERNSTSRNTPFDSGRIRSEPLPWLADDVLAVQRIRPEEGKTDKSPVLDHGPLFQNSPLRHVFRPRLSEEQKHILAMVLRGESVFFTGSAGTGKSVLLRAIIEALGGPSDEVAVTASTGISAVHIGGQTLHSFAGVGLGHGDINMLIRRIKYDNVALMRWWKAKVLIIDEVSMVDATWFDQLEQIARRIRNRDKPFGGIQLVICGDFFQLPPVPNRDFIDAPASFVFDSWTWDICVKNKFMLTQVFRQKDPKLVKMLDDARVGVVTDESAELLKSLARPVYYEDGIGPTEIYPRRFEADLANRRQLLALPGQSHVYAAHDSHGKDDDDQRVDPERAGKLFAGMMAPKLLPLKVGAQVMCLRNIRPSGLVNGSIGRVVDFMTPSQVRTYAESNPRWSIVTSIKMPQPSSQVVVPAADTQIPGRRTQTGWLYELFENTEWPLVQFMDGQCVLMGPTTFAVETRKGTMEVQRLQVPLVLAWALTVHKSQGQTLERVKINLERTFEKGQAYVALSRCTSLETLEVYGFDRHRSVQAHPRVQQWARSLTTLNSLAPPAAGSRRYPYPVRKTRKALVQ